MFDVATRMKFRFPSARGELSVEQLWEVPLRSKDDFNLDKIARGVDRELKATTEESFVDSAVINPASKVLSSKLNIVKHIIAVKLEEEEAAKTRAAHKAEYDNLVNILAEKQQDKLGAMSEKDLRKRISELRDKL